MPLPAADSVADSVNDESPRVIVNVLGDGQILLAGERVDRTKLQQRLAFERRRTGDALEVRIRGDRGVPYQFVEPVLLAAARADIWNVTFAVIKRKDAG